MWYDTVLHKQKDYSYFYTEYEKDTKYNLEKENMSTIFPSKNQAQEYINLWSGIRNTDLQFSNEQDKLYRVLVTHFEIMEVK